MKARLVSIPDEAFIEDYKKAVQEKRGIIKLKASISPLEQQINLLRPYRSHPINHAFLNFYSAQYGPDCFLIYRVPSNACFLARLGSHEQLYGP